MPEALIERSDGSLLRLQDVVGINLTENFIQVQFADDQVIFERSDEGAKGGRIERVHFMPTEEDQKIALSENGNGSVSGEEE